MLRIYLWLGKNCGLLYKYLPACQKTVERRKQAFGGCMCSLQWVFKLQNNYNHTITIWQFLHRAKTIIMSRFSEALISRSQSHWQQLLQLSHRHLWQHISVCSYPPGLGERLRHCNSTFWCYSHPWQIPCQSISEGSFLEKHEKVREKPVHRVVETPGMQEAGISALTIILNIDIIFDANKWCNHGAMPVPFYLLYLFFIAKDTKFPQVVLPVSSYNWDEQNQWLFWEDILYWFKGSEWIRLNFSLNRLCIRLNT